MLPRTLRSAVGALAVPFAVAVLALGAGACSSDDSSSSTTSTTAGRTTTTMDTVTKSGPIALSVGGRATIELEANRTTGYEWEPTSAPDTDIVKIVGDTYVPPGTSRVGAPGVQRIVLEGVATGITTLTLGYVRPWEQGVAPAQTATFAITVS
jgi:inhibitor of cysteine peptidase